MARNYIIVNPQGYVFTGNMFAYETELARLYVKPPSARTLKILAEAYNEKDLKVAPLES